MLKRTTIFYGSASHALTSFSRPPNICRSIFGDFQNFITTKDWNFRVFLEFKEQEIAREGIKYGLAWQSYTTLMTLLRPVSFIYETEHVYLFSFLVSKSLR